MQPTRPGIELGSGARQRFAEAPLVVIWEVTRSCDLACVHCRACATTARDSGELTMEEGKRVLDEIAAMGTPLMVLTGGDPAKRPDLVELVRHGTKAGLTMGVTPSGTALMTRELLAELKDAGMARLAVSDLASQLGSSSVSESDSRSDSRSKGLYARSNPA